MLGAGLLLLLLFYLIFFMWKDSVGLIVYLENIPHTRTISKADLLMTKQKALFQTVQFTQKRGNFLKNMKNMKKNERKRSCIYEKPKLESN